MFADVFAAIFVGVSTGSRSSRFSSYSSYSSGATSALQYTRKLKRGRGWQ
jgi:hypothetical protein